MSYLEAALLGLLQGLTEFLPVSSSGHLVIAQHFLGVTQPGVTFEVLVHFGTLLSIVCVFWQDIYNLLRGFLHDEREKKLLILLLIGTIPAGVMGLLLGPFFKGLFDRPDLVGVTLLVTGLIVWIINNLKLEKREIKDMYALDALVIGIFQGIAIIPGISRSGSTILGSLLRGLDRETAIRYSFLLALPAIAGATFLEFWELLGSGERVEYLYPYLLATVVAFVSGIFAIRLFIGLLKRRRFFYFSYYCWLVGIVTIIFSSFHF